MASYNRVILVGNLTQDPELKYLPSGTAMQLKVAVDRGRANQQGERETDFFNVVVWERQAETSAEYLSKGRPVLVEGRLQNRSWEGQDGQKRYATDIRADRVIFLGTRERQEGGGFSGGDGGAQGGALGGGFGGAQGSEFSGGHGDDFGGAPVQENNLPETDDDIAF